MGDAYFDTHIIIFMKKVVKWCREKGIEKIDKQDI